MGKTGFPRPTCKNVGKYHSDQQPASVVSATISVSAARSRTCLTTVTQLSQKILLQTPTATAMANGNGNGNGNRLRLGNLASASCLSVN